MKFHALLACSAWYANQNKLASRTFIPDHHEPIMDVLNQVANREGFSSSDVEDWLNIKNELPTSPQLSDEQILESVVGQSSFEYESSNEEEEEEGQDEKIVSNSEAVECSKKCLSWMERQSNVDAIQIMQL